ncbi:MAG: PAS domain S-box protein, partial [Geobacter sp.]|nr:PAS domain S-box protein [Geobacter sp.]
MTPAQMDRLVQGMTWGMGLLLGLLTAALLGVTALPGLLLWPGLALVGVFFFVQQRLARKSRLLLEKEETAALKRLVEMKREVDKTARRYKSLLEGAGNAIFVFNAETGGLQEVNRKGTELFGYTKEEMLSLTGKDLTPAPDRRRFSDLVRRVKRRGRGRAESLSFRRKDGEDFLGEVEARLIDLDDEKLVHVTLRDITFKQRAEREIKQRNRELSILNAIIGRANESLQLETVLAAILTETMEVFTAEAGVIHLQQHDGTGMTLATQSNLRETLTCRLERLACSSDERYCCHSLAVPHPRTCPVVVHATEDGWRTLAGVPLFAKQKVIGVLHILHTTDRTYTPEEIRFFATIGHQIGIAIENARLYEQVARLAVLEERGR